MIRCGGWGWMGGVHAAGHVRKHDFVCNIIQALTHTCIRATHVPNRQFPPIMRELNHIQSRRHRGVLFFITNTPHSGEYLLNTQNSFDVHSLARAWVSPQKTPRSRMYTRVHTEGVTTSTYTRTSPGVQTSTGSASLSVSTRVGSLDLL